VSAATVSDYSPFEDSFFRQVTDGRGNVLAPMVTNIWGELVYRKTTDRPFTIPVDHVGGQDAEAARAQLTKNYRRLARGRLT
jgi:hypothetical protein